MPCHLSILSALQPLPFPLTPTAWSVCFVSDPMEMPTTAWTSPHSTVQAVLLQDLLGLTCDALCAWVQDLPDWQEILTYFRGSELQNYFTRILEDDLKAIIKPQYVDHIPKVSTARNGSCKPVNFQQTQHCILWLIGFKPHASRAGVRAVCKSFGPQTSD